MSKDRLGRSIVYKGFRKTLTERFGEDTARQIWRKANENLYVLEKKFPRMSRDNKLMILPATALYGALREHSPDCALVMLKAYGTETGEKIAKIIHSFTSVPGVPQLLWKNMPKLMRKMSSPEAGYTRRIISETKELVGVDILSCPLHDAAIRIGMPEAAQVICAMDKAYMTGFRHIRYTRTTSVAEGGECCDYRLSYDKNKH